MKRSTPRPESLPPSSRREANQIFRDDSRARWRRVRLAFFVVVVGLTLLGVAFARTLRPHHAVRQDAAPKAASMTLATIRDRALLLGRAGAVAANQAEHLAQRPGAPGGAAIRMAIVDASEQEAVRSLETHAGELTHVAIEGLHVRDAQGGILGWVPEQVLAVGKAKKLVMLEVIDDVRDDVPHPGEISKLGRDRALTRRFAADVRARLLSDGAQGVMLSFGDDEADVDGKLRLAILEEVSAQLAPAGLVTAVGFSEPPSTASLARRARVADLVLLRAYHTVDPGSLPAPLAARGWVESLVDGALPIVPRDKLVIALSTRAGAWPVTDGGSALHPVGGARGLQWTEVVARARAWNVTPTWDASTGSSLVVLPGLTGIPSSALAKAAIEDPGGVSLVTWLSDGATFSDGLTTLRAHGLDAVAIGNLGGEDPRIWSVLRAPAFDREALRTALGTMSHHHEPDVVGDGVAMDVDATEHDGTATIELSPDGFVAAQRYDALPASPTVLRRGKIPSKTVVLTFDDGPDEEYTAPILDILREEHVRAAFFVVGARAERQPDLLRRAVADGHEIGNHSFSHPDMGMLQGFDADLQINSTNRLLEALTGRSTVLFRPPFRSNDWPTLEEDFVAIANGNRNGMMTVTANIDPHDWARPDPDVIVDYVLRRVDRYDGGMILLHDGGGDRKNTVAALRPMIQRLRDRGYTFSTIHDVLGVPSIEVVNPPVAGGLDVGVGRVGWIGGTWALRALQLLAIGALALGICRFLALLVCALLDLARSARDRREIRRTSRLPRHAKVSVVIPAYNEAKVIERTISSVLASRGVDLEVLVMDDGSKDDTYAIVRRAFYFEPRVRLVRLKNGGKARALNEGFKMASNEIVVAMDADTIFLPDTIVELVRKFDDERVAAVAGYAAVGNTKHFIGRWQALEYTIGQAIERRAWRFFGVVSVVPGAVGAWRRRPVLAVGGFGTDTLAEDCDLTFSLQVAGWRVEYAPDAIALTEAPESVRALLKQRFRWCFGVLQTMWKHRRAMVSTNRRNAVGLLLMPAIVLTHLATPLLAPLADLAAIVAVALGYYRSVLPYAVALLAAELLLTIVALVIDRGRIALMWDWLVNRSVYRWILFVALSRAVIAAVRGGAVGWGKLARTGSVLGGATPLQAPTAAKATG